MRPKRERSNGSVKPSGAVSSGKKKNLGYGDVRTKAEKRPRENRAAYFYAKGGEKLALREGVTGRKYSWGAIVWSAKKKKKKGGVWVKASPHKEPVGDILGKGGDRQLQGAVKR